MRPPLRIKTVATRIPVRKAATSATAAARRTFPAWIDAADGSAFSATMVTPRLRGALVLRVVAKTNSVNPRSAAHGSGAR